MEFYRPNVKGCTDVNCLLVKNTGVVTNGGCQCAAEIRRVPHGFDAIRTIGFLRSQMHAAQRRIAELEGERDRLRIEISTMVIFMREAKLCPDWDRMPVRIHQNIDEIFRAIARAALENGNSIKANNGGDL